MSIKGKYNTHPSTNHLRSDQKFHQLRLRDIRLISCLIKNAQLFSMKTIFTISYIPLTADSPKDCSPINSVRDALFCTRVVRWTIQSPHLIFHYSLYKELHLPFLHLSLVSVEGHQTKTRHERITTCLYYDFILDYEL